MNKIDKKITGYKVASGQETAPDPITPTGMHESIGRDEVLEGATYKLKTPLSEHALYITINDIVLNAGTDHESRHIYEIFFNSKNMEHFQWATALTRVVSAVFRKGGDVSFLAEELKAIEDPKGGFWNKGKFVPSLVALIGETIETHLKRGAE